jgi:hypothetical protein
MNGVGTGSAGGYNLSSSPGTGNSFGPVFGGGNGAMTGMQYAFPTQRQGSLSQEQQMELMDVLETEGMGDIDAFLHAPMGLSQNGMEGIRWA